MDFASYHIGCKYTITKTIVIEVNKQYIVEEMNEKDNNALNELIFLKGSIVPFIGAGFSTPACPGWGTFLENCFEGCKEDFFLENDKQEYEKIKSSNDANKKQEKICDELGDRAGLSRTWWNQGNTLWPAGSERKEN